MKKNHGYQNVLMDHSMLEMLLKREAHTAKQILKTVKREVLNQEINSLVLLQKLILSVLITQKLLNVAVETPKRFIHFFMSTMKMF